jgi:hypothetical protein
VPRSEWGASSCRPRAGADYGVVKAAHVHHTVNSNDYSPDEAKSIVLAICRFHRNSNGWNDIGYNFLVDKYGTIYEGRAGGVDRAVAGAQAQGYNSQTTGIANIGDHRSVPQSPQALAAIARLIRWKLPLHGAPTSGSTTLVSAGGGTNRYGSGRRVRVRRILGHRDTNSTSCPGDALYAQLAEIRRLAGDVGPAGTGTSLGARLSRRTIRFRRRVRVRGTLATAAGGPLAGRRVYIQVRRGRRWRVATSRLTRGDGTFSALVRPRENRTLRARFRGGGGLLPASSTRMKVKVRPLIVLLRPLESGTDGSRLRFRGRVAPRKRRLLRVLELRRRGEWTTVGIQRLRSRRGRFRFSFVPDGAGLYRVYLIVRADRRTARARSATHELTVGR